MSCHIVSSLMDSTGMQLPTEALGDSMTLQTTMATIATCSQDDSGHCVITVKGAACESYASCH